MGDQLPTEEDMSGTTASTQAVVISLTAKENVPPNFPQVIHYRSIVLWQNHLLPDQIIHQRVCKPFVCVP